MSIEELKCKHCGQVVWAWFSDIPDDTRVPDQGFKCFTCGKLSPLSLGDDFLEFLHDMGYNDPEDWSLVEVYRNPNEAAERTGCSGTRAKVETQKRLDDGKEES